MISNPYFIISNPRSGSSLLRILLNHHPNTSFPPECGFMQWLYPKYKSFFKSDIPSFIEDLSKTKKIEGWELDFRELENYLYNSSPSSYQDLCFYVYNFYSLNFKEEIKVWGDKNNYYINHLDELNSIFPYSKFIHLTRDIRDVCASYLNLNNIKGDITYKPNLPTNVREIFYSIRNNETQINNFFRDIKSDRIYKISYENLLTSPKKELNLIGKFLGLDFKDVLDNFNNNIYFDEPEITIGWKRKTLKNIDPTNINLYKHHPQRLEIEKYYKYEN